MTDLAIVTGASRGLGAAIAEELLDRGCAVHGVARGDTSIAGRDGYRHHRVDLSVPEDVERWWEEALVPDAGSPDRVVLVNNAGRLAPLAPLERAECGGIAAGLALNVATPAWLMGACARRFEGVRLVVVNVSSGAATSPYAGWGTYCASKAALRMAGRVFAVEVEERDVRVLDYAPGVVATEMQAEIRAAEERDFPQRERFVALHEDGELVEPREPAREVVGIALDEPGVGYEELRFPARSG